MIRKLDIYIIRKFLGTFLFAILLIISIAIVFDISERIDDFIEKQVPFSEIVFNYYLNFIPYFVNLFSYLFTFIAVIFFTSKMAYNSEIIAILSSGISFNRMLRPYFVGALIIAVFSYFMNAYIIPPSNKVRLDFWETYIKSPYRNYDRNIHRQIEPGIFIYLESYNVQHNIAYKFSLEKFDKGRLVSKLMADYAKYDEESGKWNIHNYFIRNIDGLNETIRKGREIDSLINLKPENFNFRNTIVESMTTPQLKTFIEEEKQSGVENIDAYLIELYRRTAGPFSTFILTLMAAALASRKMRGGSGIHIGIGLGLSFSYILFMRITSQFAIKGNMDPLLATWFPNIIFALIALVLYKLTPK